MASHKNAAKPRSLAQEGREDFGSGQLPSSARKRPAAQVVAAKCDPVIPWKRNGLRHSYCTYRMAVLQNEHQVSAERGNSPAMVFANYRALVTKEQGEEWFKIVPK